MMEHILNFIIPSAYADSMGGLSGGSAQGGSMPMVIMLAGMLLFMYFFIIRPQTKRAKETQSMLASLAKGDEVMTAGGILGRVTKLTDLYVVLAIANDVEVTMQKSAIVNVLPKGTLKSIE